MANVNSGYGHVTINYRPKWYLVFGKNTNFQDSLTTSSKQIFALISFPNPRRCPMGKTDPNWGPYGPHDRYIFGQGKIAILEEGLAVSIEELHGKSFFLIVLVLDTADMSRIQQFHSSVDYSLVLFPKLTYRLPTCCVTFRHCNSMLYFGEVCHLSQT